MGRRISTDEALAVAAQALEDNPDISREDLAELIRSGGIAGLRGASRFNEAVANAPMAGLRGASQSTQALADAPIGVDTPMGPMGTPGYLQEQSLYQPSDISKTLGYASVVPTSSEEARIRDLERAGFAMDMMNLEKMSMMDSAPMEDREKVSVGGQTYMLPSDPVARERYRKSLMQQQAKKDMMAAGASMPKGRGKIDSVNVSSMLADMRRRPLYDEGFRTGLEAVQHSGPLTLDKLRTMTGPGLSEDADRFRSYVSSEMPSGRFDADPQMIKELGYREALEATEQKMMQQQKDRVLTEGISFMPAAEEITIDDTGM